MGQGPASQRLPGADRRSGDRGLVTAGLVTYIAQRIDLLAILLEKTKGNLEIDERRLLENSVTELRFRFVQVSDELRTLAPDLATTPRASTAAAPGCCRDRSATCCRMTTGRSP